MTTRSFALLLIVLGCFLVPTSVQARVAINPGAFATTPANTERLSEKDEIEFLLSEMSVSKGTYIRNGSNYDGIDASKHLRRKYRLQLREIETAKDFIEKVAYKSSFSGKPYLVRTNNNTLTLLKTDLYQKLSTLESETIIS